jgi:PKD domain/CHAP domain
VTTSRGDRAIKRLFQPLAATIAVTLSAGLAGGLLAAPAGASTPAAATAPATAPSSAAAASWATGSTLAVSSAALVRAYVSARHLPAGAVAGIRAGSLHSTTIAGVTWAIADFTPATSVDPSVESEFEDGAGTGIFRQVAGQPWQLIQTGRYGCDRGLPAGLSQAWGLPTVICQAAITPQRRAASAALAQASTALSIGQTIANVALGQVGVSASPAVTSFGGLDCNPYSTLTAALSPNADGCGLSAALEIQDENEPWCADFAKWVWEQAGVTTDLGALNAGAGSFYDWGTAQGESMPIDGGTPAAGDAVVFFPPGDIAHPAYADHVGIVTAVNPDGTVNVVNGDFLGSSNISVQYDTKVSLTKWAAQIWGPGEQWALVAPPISTQRPAPTVTVSTPQVAVTGTLTSFTASGMVPSGTISQYQWTFGDGRTTNQGGADVSTVFPGAGIYPVTLTATASTGTVVTRAWDVDVVGVSSAATTIPSDAVWWGTTPVAQNLFVPTASGGLVAESSDGQSWLRQAVTGLPGVGGGLTALAYPDAAATGSGYAMTAHTYYRAPGGTLAETYQAGIGWAAKTLAGQPEAGSALVATTAGSAAASAGAVPAVFYFGAGGQLSETVEQGSSWVTSTLPAPHTTDAAALALADTGGATAGIEVFSLGAPGTLTVTSETGSGWKSTTITSPNGVAANSPLSAVSTSATVAGVFFVDAQGSLAEANQAGQSWAVHTVPGTTSSTALVATSHSIGSGLLGPEVFWLTHSGQPDLTVWTGQQWQTTTLPGVATSIPAVSGYPGQPTELFLTDGTTLRLDATTGSGTAWTVTTLPDTAATLADRVMLYAATPGDAASARSAASSAGWAAGDVTQSFSAAWAAALTGDYLIAVGSAADNALYFNTCGWTNPSGEAGGGTPFDLASEPLNRLPGVDLYEDGAAATAAQTPQLAAGLAYYATHGALPAEVTKLPAAADPKRACSGKSS